MVTPQLVLLFKQSPKHNKLVVDGCTLPFKQVMKHLYERKKENKKIRKIF